MFILEESQLLEDTIKSSSVLNLYKTLRKEESSNNRIDLIQKVLRNDLSVELLQILSDLYASNEVSINDSSTFIGKLNADQKEEIFTELNLDQNDTANLALVVAATLTHLFVVDNFTGPTNGDLISSAYNDLPEVYEIFSKNIDCRSLSIDGSDIYHKTTNPWLLRVASLLWNLLVSIGCSRRLLELEFLVWKHRTLTVHLMILLEPAESVIVELRKIQEFIFDHHVINDARENRTQLARFNTVELCCELIQSALIRDGVTACRKIFDYASEMSGISIEHTGVLGRRTRYQQSDVPQLVIKVKKIDKTQQVQQQQPIDDGPNDEDLGGLPLDVKLDDDTLLPEISFVKDGEEKEESKLEMRELSFEAQLLMITRLDYILKTEVMEESLKDEWTQAYLRSIIKSATIWAVKYKALALRSVVEKKHMRKMDRALLQLEELIKIAENQGTSHSKRMRSFYAVLPQSRWQTQRSLGDISFELALFKNALEIYTQIEYWEGMIKCYTMLGQTVKSEAIIRQELEKEQTPYLYCLLGDATENIEFYEKSWTLSNGRFARAKKSIGTHYYTKKQYAEAIENYELALKANPSNISILSLLAYSCLTLERYERAAECYRSLTYLDDTNFLAWNNLSKAYIKLNQKERAWRTLQEAIKCNYDEWKVWENFMVVSMQIGALDDVITAWHRLLDIKSAHKDDQILSALTHSLLNRSYGKIDKEFTKLLKDALKLVARLNSTSGCSSRMWICYFKLLVREFEIFKSTESEVTKLDIDSRVSKISNALQRATPTSVVSEADWFRTPEKVDRILDSYDELVDCYSYAIEALGTRAEIRKQWRYFKLSTSNVLKTLNKHGYSQDT